MLNCVRKSVSVLSALLLPVCALSAQEPDAPAPSSLSSLSEVQVLPPVTVTEKAPPMVVVADTVVINTSAFIVEDDAPLAALLEKIPGIEIDESGNVSLNGKPVRQLLVNGKKFFGGDVKKGLKNIPARMLDKIKAYERPSDFSRITGIDDGEEEPVLDVSVKPEFMKGWNNELRAAGGTGISPEGALSGRYRAHFDANRVTKTSHTAFIANATDINKVSANVSGRNQSGSGNAGEGHRGDIGATYSLKTDRHVVNASAQYDGAARWVEGRVRSENMSATNHYDTDSRTRSKSFSGNVNARLDYEWHPSKQLTFFFKPAFRYTGRSALSTGGLARELNPSLSYSTHNRAQSFNDRYDAAFQFIVTRRFAAWKGSSLSFQTQLHSNDYFDGQDHDYQTHYYNKKSRLTPGADSLLLTRTHLDTRTGLREVMGQLSLNAPLVKRMHLQATYRAVYKYYRSSRTLYDLRPFGDAWSLPEATPDWYRYQPLPEGYADCLYPPGCAQGEYHYFGQIFTLNYRYVTKKLNLTAGLTANRQFSKLLYPEGGALKDTVSTLWNFAPNLRLRYKHTKSTYLEISYRSWAGQPGVDRMLPVANSTNPLYVRRGNPGLKPSFTQVAGGSFHHSDVRKHFSAVLSAEARRVSNAVSNSSDYDPETGVRTVTPVNIDGTWSAKGSLVLNYTFPRTLLSLSGNTVAEYAATPSYLYNSRLKADELNRVGRMMLRQRIGLNWRSKWVEASLNLRGEYTMERSSARPELNQDPFTLSAGLSVIGRLPWKMNLSADFTPWVQRGYLYDELNREYYILNARITQRFFKGALSLSLIGSDLLGQMQNLTRAFSAERRSVSEYNGVNRCVLLQAVWRFKLN